MIMRNRTTACMPHLLLLVQAQDAIVQPPDVSVHDADNCAIGGEPNTPYPKNAVVSCGGNDITEVLWAEYGTATGQCKGTKHPYVGYGGKTTFKSSPACHLDVKKKVTELCIGKAGGKKECKIPAWNGNVVFESDPCSGVGKWLAVVVACSSSWGWNFILVLFVGAVLYVGSGVAYMHKVRGKPIGGIQQLREALPHQEQWISGYGLVQDGAMFTYKRIQQARGLETAGDGKYESLPNAGKRNDEPLINSPKKKAFIPKGPRVLGEQRDDAEHSSKQKITVVLTPKQPFQNGREGSASSSEEDLVE